ncbi:MAG: TraR/DksA C4-type zinc finger protein [Chloroflexi bacterium]|nr:TraR/DksA C4-type zinc finger protein [Chloroflexota bacterium]
MLKKSVLEYLRKRMENYRSGLMERIAQYPEHQIAGISSDISPSDLAGNLPLLEVQKSMRDQAVQQLSQIEIALQSMEDGTYGRCAHCGERIPLPRLRRKPHAILCVNCKSRSENK